MKRVSLKMIAEELGVSIATVSLVLNGKDKNGRVGRDTAKKILDKAAELNYMPNTLAKGLKMGRSKTIGLIVADISNVFFGTLALYVQEYADKEGYTVIVANTNEQVKNMERMIKLLKSRQVDGLIITPTEGSEYLIEDLLKDKMPLVLVDRSFSDLPVNSVLINNYEISYKSTKQLIQQGCKNIAFVTYKQNHFHINERKRGYYEAVKEVGLYKEDNIQEVRYEFLKSDIDRAISYLVKKEEKIDGIFFATNSISIAGVKSLYKHHLVLQRDIQIMCFDESDAFYLVPFSIPFVKQPIEEMAQHAIQILLDQIEERNLKVEKCFLDAELILR
ncbi:MAG TPA: LacI family transcriptional regulator [Clostridiaceae bacterium]|nr:LacI family transcriptional regulator [Clostridiaceae bacterium]